MGYFDEIIGYEDVKRELNIIRDMLVNSDLYESMGATRIRGLLLFGDPGTGKTTMADCLIRSTGRKCFTCRKKSSDGSFVDEIVKTFEKAKKNAPSIVFFDDIDKFSDKKDEDSKGAEEFVTIQSCIDELEETDVFVIATANDGERLPDSLLRPGRLGKTIWVRNPRKEEAAEILKFYLDRTNTGNDLDPVSIAMMLQGESCAILENVIRTAAIKAAYNRQDVITMDNIVDVCLDLVFEAPENDMKYSEETLKRAAYHECGHVVAAEILDPGSVSIVSIRQADSEKLGFVRYCRKEPAEVTFEDYENTLKISLAGKAATEIVFGDPDLGVNNDLHNAFMRARHIADNFCVYGFHNWLEDLNTEAAAENRNYTMSVIMERSYMEVKQMLVKNRYLLETITAELLEKNTLVHSDIRRIIEDSHKKNTEIKKNQCVEDRNDKPSFSRKLRQDNFIVDNGNRDAYEAVFSAPDNTGDNSPILFIYGEHGTGKTHLLQAFGHHLLEHHPEAEVLYMTGVQFTDAVIEGVRTSKMHEFRERCRNVDYLMIDDIDFLIGKECTSNEMINLIKDLTLDDKIVIVTSHHDFTKDSEVDENFRAIFNFSWITEIRRKKGYGKK